MSTHQKHNASRSLGSPKSRRSTRKRNRRSKGGPAPRSKTLGKAGRFKHVPAHRRAAVPDLRQPIMISCFDRSGVMARPWAEAGFLCYIVDMQHKRGDVREGNIIKIGTNMLDWLPPRGDIRFASFFPPCTDVAVPGAQWFPDKGLGALMRTLELFKRSVDIAEMIGCKYLIENPRSVVSTHWRQPDYRFHPNEYGDDYLKETLLWTGGGFKMPKKAPVEPIKGMKLYLLPPSPERANLRSETPEGFARAVFNANSRPQGVRR